MLAQLVAERMRDEKLSLRSAAKQIQTSHTTITRILEGKNIDLDTLKNVCTWLGVSTAEVLRNQYDEVGEEEKMLGTQISLLINTNPKLAKAFKEIFVNYNSGKIAQTDIEEILSFIAYKLGK